jgi:hypothetical protein
MLTPAGPGLPASGAGSARTFFPHLGPPRAALPVPLTSTWLWLSRPFVTALLLASELVANAVTATRAIRPGQLC